VVVANSNHFGAASTFAAALAEEGLVGLVLTNSDALVVPKNGRAARIGTNPISLAARGQDSDVFCADVSTSQSSFLRSLALRAAGAPLPSGILVDAAGVDVAESGGDPAALLPLGGGHKGQCLGMMVTILSALLAGGPFDWEIPNLYASFSGPQGVSHLFLAIDIGAVTDRDVFANRLSQYLTAFRRTPGLDGIAVVCPGDVEAQLALERRRQGVPLAERDYEFLTQLEGHLGSRSESRPAHDTAEPIAIQDLEH
jgi:LDH2 family malate/lactate/ureidoglycolate dehydrogenase